MAVKVFVTEAVVKSVSSVFGTFHVARGKAPGPGEERVGSPRHEHRAREGIAALPGVDGRFQLLA